MPETLLYALRWPQHSRFKVGITTDLPGRLVSLAKAHGAPSVDDAVLLQGPVDLITRAEKAIHFLLGPHHAPLPFGDGCTEFFWDRALPDLGQHLALIQALHPDIRPVTMPVREVAPRPPRRRREKPVIGPYCNWLHGLDSVERFCRVILQTPFLSYVVTRRAPTEFEIATTLDDPDIAATLSSMDFERPSVSAPGVGSNFLVSSYHHYPLDGEGLGVHDFSISTSGLRAQSPFFWDSPRGESVLRDLAGLLDADFRAALRRSPDASMPPETRTLVRDLGTRRPDEWYADSRTALEAAEVD